MTDSIDRVRRNNTSIRTTPQGLASALAEAKRDSANWMDPLNKKEIKAAVKAKKPTVKLLSGQILSITYIVNGLELKAEFHPTKQVNFSEFAPCGKMVVKDILSVGWED